jgi:hypothetical protein
MSSAVTRVAPVGRPDESRATWADAVALLLCCFLPLILTVARLLSTIRQHAFAIDFHHYYWPSGTYVLHGHSPFPPPTANAVSLLHLYPAGEYPAPVAVFFAPFGLLPLWLAESIFTVVLVSAVVVALHLVGVRDWRCYGIAFLWAPVAFGIQTANLSLLLLLGLGLLWRLRDKVARAALVVGTLISLKLFLWPLVVWLLATRRYLAAAWSLMVALTITLVSWAILGFAGFHDYPRVARIFVRYYETSSYTPYAFLVRLGASGSLARVGGLVLGVAALGAVVVVARRRHSDVASFTFAVGAALLCSPIVWLHYFALLLVPLAILSPVFSIAWVLPLILWACPVGAPSSAWTFALPLVVCAVALLVAQRDWLRPRAISWVLSRGVARTES